MPRVKIKSLDNRTATAGQHFASGNPLRRKLQPGEVVDIPESEVFSPKDDRLLFDVLWATGKLEITPEPATRPLDYASVQEAKFCAPTFRPRGPDEIILMDKARADVAARLAETSEVPAETGSPADDKPAAESSAATQKVAPAPVRKQKPAAPNRRVARRAAAQDAVSDGAENTA